jgi:hypothetical protein
MATSLFLDVQSDPLLMFIMQVCLERSSHILPFEGAV